MIKVREIQAKSILNKSKVFDYCLNPYTGCQLSCAYCYARLFMRRYSGHQEPWGQFVDVKINAPLILKKQLEKAKRGKIWISSVCDPYQPAEKKYKLTRQCLKELAAIQFPMYIQTKSALVLRDLDLFQQFEEIEVGFTITTDNPNIARLFEPRASSIKERLEALGEIHSQKIKTFAFVGPLLPGSPEKLVEKLQGKADKVYIDRMNYLWTIKKFYHGHRLEKAATEKFFFEYKKRLVDELRKRGMKAEVLF
ncbi:MAG: radical SAM protein [Candidatus Aminicenantes bacterium]